MQKEPEHRIISGATAYGSWTTGRIHLNLSLIMATLLSLLPVVVFAQKDSSLDRTRLVCPMKKGRILMSKSTVDISRIIPTAAIVSRSTNVIAVGDGTVNSVYLSRVSKKYVVSLFVGDYNFIYHDLDSVSCVIGQVLRAGERIGYLKRGHKIYLWLDHDGKFLNPLDVLPCRRTRRNK